MRVLLVEDDIRLAEALQQILSEAGYQADAVHDGAEGLTFAESGAYDALVLDVMLPSMDGFQVAANLRQRHISTPILMLTALANVPNKVQGLDSGADAYLTKPFAPAELLAHLRALTRRQGEVVFKEVSAGDLLLNLDSGDLTCAGKSIHLSAKETSMAQIFLTSPHQVFSKEQLVEKVWGYDAVVEENNVEAYVSFLRKKIRYIGSAATIEALRMRGYRLNPGEANENGE